MSDFIGRNSVMDRIPSVPPKKKCKVEGPVVKEGPAGKAKAAKSEEKKEKRGRPRKSTAQIPVDSDKSSISAAATKDESKNADGVGTLAWITYKAVYGNYQRQAVWQLDQVGRAEFGDRFDDLFPNAPTSTAQGNTKHKYREDILECQELYRGHTFRHGEPPILVVDWTEDGDEEKSIPVVKEELLADVEKTPDAQRVIDAHCAKARDYVQQGGKKLPGCKSPCECLYAVDNSDDGEPSSRLNLCCYRGPISASEFNRGNGRGCIFPVDSKDAKRNAKSAEDMVKNPMAMTEDENRTTEVYFCTEACTCKSHCMQRMEQYGRRAPLVLFRHPAKGWTVRTLARIPYGQSVVLFPGKVITASAMRKIQKTEEEVDGLHVKNWVFTMQPTSDARAKRDKKMDSKGAVDPVKDQLALDFRVKGNESRYVGHSCAPNCRVLSVYPHREGSVFPRLLMVARCDIAAGKEVTFDYGYGRDEEWLFNQCICGYERCRLPLPRAP